MNLLLPVFSNFCLMFSSAGTYYEETLGSKGLRHDSGNIYE